MMVAHGHAAMSWPTAAWSVGRGLRRRHRHSGHVGRCRRWCHPGLRCDRRRLHSRHRLHGRRRRGRGGGVRRSRGRPHGCGMGFRLRFRLRFRLGLRLCPGGGGRHRMFMPGMVCAAAGAASSAAAAQAASRVDLVIVWLREGRAWNGARGAPLGHCRLARGGVAGAGASPGSSRMKRAILTSVDAMRERAAAPLFMFDGGMQPIQTCATIARSSCFGTLAHRHGVAGRHHHRSRRVMATVTTPLREPRRRRGAGPGSGGRGIAPRLGHRHPPTS